MPQTKKQDKTSEKELNEVETGNLLNKEFKVMIIKMLPSSEEWMNMVRISTNSWKILRTKQSWSIQLTKIKITLEGINSRLDDTE